MNNSKLSSLLSKLEELSSEASELKNEFSVESLNDELSRNLKGGKLSTNGSCAGGSNQSCSNGTCSGSTNSTCHNVSC
nr:hypothetical protein [Mucilaginibacter sp. X5P1]